MRNIIYSCFSKSDPTYIEALEMFEMESDNYVKNFKVSGVLHEKEREYFDFIIKSFQGSGTTPSQKLMCDMFPELKTQFMDTTGITEISSSDLRVYIFNLVDARVNEYVSKRIAELNIKVRESGITSEIASEFDKLQKLSNRNKAKDIDISIDGKENYTNLKLRPLGMVTGIKAIDDKIGGMNEGTMSVIAGFTSQFKTTFAVNIAYLNSYFYGYNVAYITLETPKQDMYWNLLSLHSYDTKFSKYSFIGHDRMRQCKLTPEEESYLFDVVEMDLKESKMEVNGEQHNRGKIVFLDESDFDSFSFGEIQAVLEKVDEKLGGNLDAVIVDYIQLCKFSGKGVISDETTQINAYASFFRRISQNFKKITNENGEEKTKQLIVVLLSQIRRESWRKAATHNGVYDITCMSDSSELEKSAMRIFTTYTTEEMKQRKVAQVQILKNRTGQTLIAEPATVFADGEFYAFMDEDGMDTNTFAVSGDATSSLEAAFSGIGSLDALLGV